MNKLKTIGVILDDDSKQGLNHTFFSEILESFKIQVEKNDCSLIFLNNDRSRDNAETYLQQLTEYRCAACIIACVNDSEEITEILNSGIPVAAIDKEYENTICVSSDNDMGMEMLTDYVIEMGHTKISIILGDDNEITNIRLNGFLRSCAKSHITIPDEYILRGKFRDMDKTYYHTENLLKLETPPTCIMYCDDFAAIGGINILNARGFSIPTDMSITGYDGNEILAKYEPSLTTIKQDGVEIGKTAADKLIKLINGDETVKGKYKVESHLQKGRTVRKIYY